ncbi:Disease resistance protein (CC-NBS-LRR class) family [Rhynchospora pubera]|uniref:Disease resistance protein (CC-NBS-LRR class) family n=1 Tax=Rhynchospora pubera TaxID=906938 RepID=A0AAV8DJE1_9POAL|nr:Disease resistance protein (CC-NBS-LRR class) family [Rhynchospora pubera]
MAESIVSFVVGKLGDVVVREVLKLHGVSEQVERVSRELNRIQAFLKDADRKRIVDERQRHWVKEVRDLAYSIEDVIDTFLIEVPEYKPGKKEAVKRWFTKTRKLPAVLRIGDEMNKIEARIQEIEASRVRYGIANIGESIEGEIRRPMRQIVLPDIDETGIVGFEADIHRIVSLLLHKETTRRAVVSIVGTGGLGKTTLARKVYNRSMIQVSRFSDGSIGECHIHDLLHGLAIQKAKDDNFLIVCSKIDEMQNHNHMRRLAIHDSLWNCEDEKTEELYGKSSVASATPNLRSLLSCRQIPKVLQLMHLKVLSNTGSLTSSEFDHLVNYRRLNQLRYVQLKLLVQCRKDIQNFEKFIAGLRFLQTLDIRNSDLSGCNLPDCVWHIKTLRHVLLPRTKASAYGPPPSVDLINLQTLFGVISRETWGTEGLPNLITLDFRTSNGFQWNTIVALLGTLEHLLSLGINGDDASLNIIDMKGFPFYHHLQELSLSSNTKKIALHHGMFPIHLTTLILELQFQQDPMPVLEKLQRLRFLSLRCCNGEQLCCSTGGFGQLEELMIDNLCELEELKIEKGAMPMLKTFYVYNCPLLHVPPGLQHLTLLEEIKWSGPAMNETMEDEIRTICKMYLPFLSCPLVSY